MQPCPSWPDCRPKDRQATPDSSSDRIAPALWLVGPPLEDGHYDMRGQGLSCELQRCPPVGLDHRAPWSSEDVAIGPPTAIHPHKTATVSQLGWLVLLGRTTTGGHGLLAAHTRHSDPSRRS